MTGVSKKKKKVKNATVTIYDNIKFKSKLEVMAYKTLKSAGFSVQYEPYTFVLIEGFKPIVPFYDKNKLGNLENKTTKIISIKYTPDFFFKYKDVNIYIEVKGRENDVFYLKKKLFRRLLDMMFLNHGINSLYFEVYNKKHLLQCINIIKNYVPPN